MNGRKYFVSNEVFEKFPGYRRFVVLARGIKNGPSPDELKDLLRSAEELLRREMKPEELAAHPRVACWKEAFKRLGVNANEFRPSMDAMARRVLKGQQLPSISALVDICNIVSLKSLVPVGGHSLDEVKGDLALRPATGEESFVPFGSTEEEKPLKGEFILAEDGVVLTRRWIWRQANHTLIVNDTRTVAVNIDCMPQVYDGAAHAIAEEMRALIERFCSSTSGTAVLNIENKEIGLDS